MGYFSSDDFRDSKFKTLADLVEYGKKNPKMLKFAGTSPGGWSEIQTVAFFKGWVWR